MFLRVLGGILRVVLPEKLVYSCPLGSVTT